MNREFAKSVGALTGMVAITAMPLYFSAWPLLERYIRIKHSELKQAYDDAIFLRSFSGSMESALKAVMRDPGDLEYGINRARSERWIR